MSGAKYYRHPGAIIRGASRRRWPVWQWALLGTGGLLLALVTLALIPPEALTSRGQHREGGLEKGLEVLLLDLERARLAPGPAPPAVRIAVSDADLNAYLAANGGGWRSPRALRSPLVAFGTGQITVTVRARLAFLSVPLTAEVMPIANDGRLRVRVKRLRVGLLPAPGKYRQSLAERAQNAVNSGLHETDFRLEELEITPGQMAVTLRPPPR